ncbi:DUF4367 domain-containing protein [Caproicibacter fermentans]|uniref:DUF4367 domain-containing protein n=1 Tax=Caproicibacter fermentans TaxID=2576756 RepID=A0A7G8T6T6_9FIRM|nr:DUF4367 domain-containing protein [Caproicibacter fermentans]QNK39327.1 DUF4367 domain-containing protein [Caproicibacter fermentans]
MVNNVKLNRELFEAMLKEAVTENFEKEMQSLPSEAALADCELSLGTKRRIESMIREARMKSLLRRVRAVTKRVAVLLAIMIPVSLGSLLSVEASRNAIFNAIIEWRSGSANITYQQSSSGSADADHSANMNVVYVPSYLPDGFTIQKEKKVGRLLVITYRDKSGKSIIFQQCSLPDAGTNAIDSEHSTYSQVDINGDQASLFQADTKDDSSFLVWKNDHSSFLLMSKVDSKELIKMAESINVK